MPDGKITDPVERRQQRDREMRASVDVLFEALAHIQASLETSSPEERKKTYQTFKEALYDRFEHLVEARTPATNWQDSQLEQNGDPDESTDEEDTLEKMWPAVADRA